MKTAAVRLLQERLVEEGVPVGDVDGRLGKQTYAGVGKALETRKAQLPEGWLDWSNHRKCVACLQCFAAEAGIDAGKIDGLWGPQTEYAYDLLAYLHENGRLPEPFRDETPLDVNPNGWPGQAEADVVRHFGETGKHQVRLELPYPHRIAWDLRKTVSSFFCHEKVHDSAARVLRRVLEHYGPERIVELRLDRWGGCLNVRRMRGGTRWSMHAWGVAIDFDPELNAWKWGRDRANMARPEYDAWWRLWEEEGWASLGRIKNYDWMHVQAVKL